MYMCRSFRDADTTTVHLEIFTVIFISQVKKIAKIRYAKFSV